ncbi:MAG: hypothetical protein AABZ08_08440 [Planctomycetota bacterium]
MKGKGTKAPTAAGKLRHKGTKVRFSLCLMGLLVGVQFGVRAEPIPPTAPASQPTTRPAIDQELVKKLLGGESSTLDTVESTLAEMKAASARLAENHDVGPQTQQSQKRIVEGIDQLIEQARRNRASSSSQQTARRPAEPKAGDRKQQSSARKSDASDPGKTGKGGMGAPANDKKATATRADDKAELSRGWGYLPLRDRQEVSQGFDEQFMGKYREEIIRYYRDLAKAAEKNK